MEDRQGQGLTSIYRVYISVHRIPYYIYNIHTILYMYSNGKLEVVRFYIARVKRRNC